jgi:hypothetical protein
MVLHFAADAGFAGVGRNGPPSGLDPIEVIMASPQAKPDFDRECAWEDSNPRPTA